MLDEFRISPLASLNATQAIHEDIQTNLLEECYVILNLFVYAGTAGSVNARLAHLDSTTELRQLH